VTGTDRGRGRPTTTFTPETMHAFLRAVTAGATQNKAAAELGISPRVVRYHAHHHPDFATALADARERGKQARYPHGATRYRHLGCRCPTCTTAASAARTDRRHTHQEQPDDRPDAQIHQLPTAEGGFPPLRPAV
jgi:hypothetical protein